MIGNDSTPDPSEVASRRIGEVFAHKWRLERVLGIGGMATVYAATHKNNLHAVALKILHPELAANVDIRRRFLREGYIANKVGHPNAVTILDDGVTEDGSVFLLMELLDGDSLADLRDRGVLPPAEALRIADGILDVLVAAHAQGIVHRDLKPDNVFVTRDGGVKVLDFGIARLLDPPTGEEATRTGVMMGTPAYMPPEQARGRSKEVDARSDVWALGAILFTVITGKHVHEAETSNEALLRAMTAHAPRLATQLPDVDPRVAVVVDRALKFDADDRWSDARAMQAAVREALAHAAPPGEKGTVKGASPASDRPPPSFGARPVTAVTKGSLPMVRDVEGGRSGGGRVAVVVIALGAAAAGLSWVVRTKPFVHASPSAPAASVGAPVVEDASGVALVAPIAAPDASPLGAPVEDASDEGRPPGDGGDVIDAEVDADLDADSYEEDDDGGEDDDDEIDAGKGGSASAAHTVRPTHRGVAPHKPKRRHKKKRR